jgi:hypothetical protein
MPQFEVSVRVFTHALHQVRPGPQQWPALHVSVPPQTQGAPHVAAQPPQLSWLVDVFTHAVPHQVSPGPQQWPALQI